MIIEFTSKSLVINKMFEDEQDVFYEMRSHLYHEWCETFVCDTDSKFVLCQRRAGVPHYHAPPIVKDNAVLGIVCLSILEKCMDAEKQYPMTFWVECMRVCLSREFVFEVEEKIESVFDSFITFMLDFNSTYPLTLPSIFHSTMQMHKACQFFMPRFDKREGFFMHVLTTDIVLKYESEVDSLLSIHEPDEERNIQRSCETTAEERSYEDDRE
jgi:hypothetical protein